MKPNPFAALLMAALLPLVLRAQEPAPAAPAAAPVPASTEAPAAPEAAPLVPKIVCDQPIFDFGATNNTGFVEHHFPIRNAGTLSLEIRNVRASCGCTAVKPSQSVIPPGGEATIGAKLDLRGRSGMQIKSITVESNDPQTPHLMLQLKGTAVLPLRAEPSTLFFGRLEPGAARTRTFEVVSGRGPIQIVGTRTDHPGLSVVPVAPEPGADGSRHRFELRISPDLPEGNVNGSVFVKTDAADLPELAIVVAAYLVKPAEPPPAPDSIPAPAP
ncbi:MAG: DUF1573 domain-containing protein [Kiritimatiellia bacterium]